MSIKILNSKIKIGKGEPVFVIAEIGKNFIQTKEEKSIEEYLINAKELIKTAKESGADAVKFQTHVLEDEQLNIKVTSPHFSGSDRYNWVKRNEGATPLEFWQEIKKYCNDIDIIFFSTPMSRKAVIKLQELDLPLWKVGSGDILDFVMLDYLASTKKPIIISVGMSTLKEVDRSVNFLTKKTDNVILMHCVSKYPCPTEELNLKTIEFLQAKYNLPIGFSDHSIGYDSAIAATNMGAVVIEKHFSFDRDLWGSDHKVSMTPNEFQKMVENIRRKDKVEVSNYGEDDKFLNNDEVVFRPFFRKSLMIGQNIKAGTKITKEMIYAMRPQAHAGGLPSEEYENILGKKIIKNLNKYDPITKDILE